MVTTALARVCALGAMTALTLSGLTAVVGAAQDTHGDAVSAVAKTQGDEISDLARSTTAVGDAKGDAISDAAQMHGAAVRAVAQTEDEAKDDGEAKDSDEAKEAKAEAKPLNAGQRVSALAHSTTLVGAARGEAISTLARTHGATMRERIVKRG